MKNWRYLPYQPRADYALTGQSRDDPADFPIPPRDLWLGHNYPTHGKLQVETMLDIVRASGLTFAAGDRILDFGCGAGRMIRHLQSLAGTCEIWGTDISAKHVLWCKRHMQPPFHFATTTKVPHLPFEDRSFRLIYCGSVFTHIDDLADAWLLELRRILTPDGRLYVTIHDERTIELLDSTPQRPEWLRSVQARKTYRQSKGSFDMFTVGRGHDSQVFYNREFFLRTVRSMFDVVSVTPEAYFIRPPCCSGASRRRRFSETAADPGRDEEIGIIARNPDAAGEVELCVAVDDPRDAAVCDRRRFTAAGAELEVDEGNGVPHFLLDGCIATDDPDRMA